MEGVTMNGCGGCGLFLHHTPDCTWHDGWKAVYDRYYQRYDESFDTYEEALAFLTYGEDSGDFYSVSIVGPDGNVVVSKAANGWDFEWPRHAPSSSVTNVT